MKRTSNGMERKGSPSGEKFVYPQPPAVNPKYQTATESWWVVGREQFNARLHGTDGTDGEAARMARVPISIPHKDAL